MPTMVNYVVAVLCTIQVRGRLIWIFTILFLDFFVFLKEIKLKLKMPKLNRYKSYLLNSLPNSFELKKKKEKRKETTINFIFLLWKIVWMIIVICGDAHFELKLVTVMFLKVEAGEALPGPMVRGINVLRMFSVSNLVNMLKESSTLKTLRNKSR